MKVLWLCNIIPGAVRAHMGGSNDGGMWTDHVLSDLRQQKLTMLLLCRGGDRSGRLDDRTAYALFSEEKPHAYSLSLETQFGIRLKEFEPDVIHIWGTEYGHCLAMVNAAEKAGFAALGQCAPAAEEIPAPGRYGVPGTEAGIPCDWQNGMGQSPDPADQSKYSLSLL